MCLVSRLPLSARWIGGLGFPLSILSPLVPARKALRLMNTDDLAAPGTGPLFFFILNELSYADLLYAYEIVNHTHTILGSITLIQVIEPDTGKAVTTEAVHGFALHCLLTVLDSACRAGF
jgi:hypothetical protein